MKKRFDDERMRTPIDGTQERWPHGRDADDAEVFPDVPFPVHPFEAPDAIAFCLRLHWPCAIPRDTASSN